MADYELVEDVTRYVGFGDADGALLARLAPALRPAFPTIVDAFYEAIEASPRAAAVFSGPEQIAQQKKHLRGWLEGIVGGDYGPSYFEQRARIGRAHVRIGLDQRYMVAAMNVVRRGLHEALDAGGPADVPRDRGHHAVDRICDLDLAIMLETYQEDYISRIKRTEQFATLGRLAASIGHELRNPLAVVETSVHLLQRRVPEDPRIRKHLDRIAQQVDTCGDIIDDLLSLARDRDPEREPADLREVVREALAQLRIGEHVTVEVEHPDDVSPAAVDGGQLRQVFANLVSNAVLALGDDPGTVWVRFERRGTTLWVAVEDSGSGIDPDDLPRLFEPLFTTRATGIGLGLSLCRQIIERHGGTVDAENRAEGGARLVLTIPGAYA